MYTTYLSFLNVKYSRLDSGMKYWNQIKVLHNLATA